MYAKSNNYTKWIDLPNSVQSRQLLRITPMILVVLYLFRYEFCIDAHCSDLPSRIESTNYYFYLLICQSSPARHSDNE